MGEQQHKAISDIYKMNTNYSRDSFHHKATRTIYSNQCSDDVLSPDRLAWCCFKILTGFLQLNNQTQGSSFAELLVTGDEKTVRQTTDRSLELQLNIIISHNLLTTHVLGYNLAGPHIFSFITKRAHFVHLFLPPQSIMSFVQLCS